MSTLIEHSPRPQQAPPSETTTVIVGMAVSFLVHASIVGAIIVGSVLSAMAMEDKVEDELAPFTPVELVRLGVDKPADALPVITNPPPKVEEEDVVNLKQKPRDKTISEKKPEKDKKTQRVQKTPKKDKRSDLLNEFEHDPTKPVVNELPRGHKEGVPEGTLSDAAAANLMRTWQAKVNAAVIRRWQIPRSLGEDKLKEFAGRTRVSVRISAEGYIVSYNFSSRSGDGHFDGTVERAVRSFMPAYGGSKLPMPENPTLRAAVVRKGFSLTGWRHVVR